jgi:hypothetical protein
VAGATVVTDGLRSVLWWLAVAALVAVALVGPDLSGLVSGPASGHGGKRAATARPTGAAPRQPRVQSVSAVSVLYGVDLDRRDVPAGFREVTARGASDLEPGDRLDLCGTAAPPEGRRLAADRRAFVAADGRRIRTEVVAYRPGGAARALAVLRAVAPACTRPVLPGPVEQPGTLALWVRSPHRPANGRPGRLVEQLLVERRGDVLVVLQVDLPRGPLTLDLARLVSLRLESQLPDR